MPRVIVACHCRLHRDAVEGEVARRLAARQTVLLIASHSSTPELDGWPRRADVAWLYDPRRPAEAAVAGAWMAALAQRAPALRLRRNYPYQGRGDGLATLLRTRCADGRYLGMERKVNQRFAAQGGAAWAALRADLVASLATALSATKSSHRR